jgi:hypothetical protein
MADSVTTSVPSRNGRQDLSLVSKQLLGVLFASLRGQNISSNIFPTVATTGKLAAERVNWTNLGWFANLLPDLLPFVLFIILDSVQKSLALFYSVSSCAMGKNQNINLIFRKVCIMHILMQSASDVCV